MKIEKSIEEESKKIEKNIIKNFIWEVILRDGKMGNEQIFGKNIHSLCIDWDDDFTKEPRFQLLLNKLTLSLNLDEILDLIKLLKKITPDEEYIEYLKTKGRII